jgi:hypothetical protein
MLLLLVEVSILARVVKKSFLLAIAINQSCIEAPYICNTSSRAIGCPLLVLGPVYNSILTSYSQTAIDN